MASLTDGAENRVLDWLTGNTTTAPTLPLKVRLMAANGSDSAAGTEVTGDTYTQEDVSLSAASGGATSNDALVSGVGIDSTTDKTVNGIEIWDSAATPFRWWHGALTTPKTVAAGDPWEIAVGDLDLTMA